MTTINSLDDFLQALDDNPAWRDAVRARILGEELLQLPPRFEAFIQQQTAFNERMEGFIERQLQFNEHMEGFNERQTEFNERVAGFMDRTEGFMEQQIAFNANAEARMGRIEGFIERQTEFNERVAGFMDRTEGFMEQQIAFNANAEARMGRIEGLIERQTEFNERVAGFMEQQIAFNANAEARMGRIESDISVTKGGHVRTRLMDLLPDLAETLEFDFVRVIPREELIQTARRISNAAPGELSSFRRADLVVQVAKEQDTLYLAVEASWTASQRDSDRAVRNADFLTETTGLSAIPVIASVRNTREVADLIESGALRWYRIEERDVQVE